MKARMAVALGFAMMIATAATAQTVILQDDFESYTGATNFDIQTAFEAAWPVTPNAGETVAGLIVPNATLPITPPDDNPPDIQGQAVNILNGLNIRTFPAVTPSATEVVHLKFDYYDDAAGNKRSTVGLRSAAPDPVANLLEMGQWNANINLDPISGATIGPPLQTPGTSKGYAYRLVLMGATANAVGNPNWQYFQLDPLLDRATDTDSIVTVADVGRGWHTYEAFVTPTHITLSLDLFRDGKHNIRDEAGVIVAGADGVDAIVTWEIALAAPNSFNTLRIGTPTGTTSPQDAVLDNILLETVAALPAANGDIDMDGDVDGSDFLQWQVGYGTLNGAYRSIRDPYNRAAQATLDPPVPNPSALLEGGDTNRDGKNNDADFAVWASQFGTHPAVGATTAIPEPASAGLVSLALAGLLGRRRRVA